LLIPYGLDRLPRDPRLRCVEVGREPLRLNGEPVSAEAMPPATGDHAARVAAAQDWLASQCGDYAPLRRKFIAAYFRWIDAEIGAHRAELIERLKPYDGLYMPEDFLWSALRPLPRGWIQVGEQFLPADIVFWDGTQAIAIDVSAQHSDKLRTLQEAGIATCRLESLPDSFRRPWDHDTLPSSPFRRPIPVSLRAQRSNPQEIASPRSQ
jgi:hypothetical protein